MTQTSTVVRLKARPSGMPGPEHFDIVEEPLAAPAAGEVQVAIRYVSVSPSLRLQMNAGDSYLQPIPLGGVVRARTVGEVLVSEHPDFAPGDHVEGPLGPRSHFTGPVAGVMKIDTGIAPLPAYLGVLGLSGLTAWYGLVEIGAPKPGDTVVVSAAAGSVGSVAGQIAKASGCRVIGIAGGPAKCTHVTDTLGFDACVDYRGEDVAKRLAELAPRGVDVFFDNVGGEILDAVLLRLALNARVVICGAISGYNDIGAIAGPRNFLKLLEMRARAEGFSIYDYAPRYAAGQARLAGLLAAEKLTRVEHIERGLVRFPEVMRILFDGSHTGKLMIEV